MNRLHNSSDQLRTDILRQNLANQESLVSAKIEITELYDQEKRNLHTENAMIGTQHDKEVRQLLKEEIKNEEMLTEKNQALEEKLDSLETHALQAQLLFEKKLEETKKKRELDYQQELQRLSQLSKIKSQQLNLEEVKTELVNEKSSAFGEDFGKSFGKSFMS